MRFYFPFLFATFFIGWVAYRIFIKKDLKQHLNSLYAGIFFMGVWGLIYWWLLS